MREYTVTVGNFEVTVAASSWAVAAKRAIDAWKDTPGHGRNYRGEWLEIAIQKGEEVRKPCIRDSIAS